MTSPSKIPDSDIAYHLDEELETLFHSDLQDLQLEHGEAAQDDVLGGHLPEWLIGVIVVVVMLILVFFVMIVRSVIRNRKSNRSSSETALNTVHADDLESGKVGHGDESGLQVTSFTSLPAGGDHSGCSQLAYPGVDVDLSNSEADTLANRGCRNPLFVDEGEDLHSASNKNCETDIRENSTFKTSVHNSDVDTNLETDYPNSGSNSCPVENQSPESGSSKSMCNKHKNHKGKKSDCAKQTTGDTRNPETEHVDKKLESKVPKFTPSRSNKRERTKSLGGSNELIPMDAPRDNNKENQKRQVSKGREDEKSLRETPLNSIPEDNAGEITSDALRPDSGLSSQSNMSKLQEDESEDCDDKDAEARAVLDAVLGGENTEDESLSQNSDTSADTNEINESESGAVQTENQEDENATIPLNSGISETTNPSSSSAMDEEISDQKLLDSGDHTFSNFDTTEDDCEHVTGKLISPFNWSTTEQTASTSLEIEGSLSQEVISGVTAHIKDSLDSAESHVNNAKGACNDQVENDNLDREEGVIRNDNKRNSTKL